MKNSENGVEGQLQAIEIHPARACTEYKAPFLKLVL